MSSKLIGKGVYTLPHAAVLLQSDTRTVRRWVEGARNSQNAQSDPKSGLICRELEPLDGVTVVTFQELIELKLIKRLREENISMPTIRVALDNARRYFHTDHPFALKRILHDGRSIFAEISPRDVTGITVERVSLELKAGQLFMMEMAEGYLTNVEYIDEVAARWYPLGRERLVVIDPERNSGNPIDPQTGVSSYALLKMVEAGENVRTTAKWFETSQQAVKDAVSLRDFLKKAA